MTKKYFITEKIHNLILLFLIRIIKTIPTSVKLAGKVLQIILKPLSWIAAFLYKKILLKIYKIYIKAKRITKYHRQRYNNKISFIINNKITAIAIVVLITSLITTNNLRAKELSRDELGRSSLLFQLVQDEFGGDIIITDSKPAQIQPISYLNNHYLANRSQTIVSDNTANQPEENTALARGGSVLIKQHLTAPDKPPTRTTIEEYVVKSGDTISSIAKKFGLSINTLLWTNKLTKFSIIRPGDKLTIPPQNGVIHSVKSGDTIKKIADLYQADEIAIIEANNINPRALKVGSQIFIPDGVPPAPKIRKKSKPKTSLSLKQILTKPKPAPANPNSGTKLLWPAKSHRINQYYSLRHRALDINGRMGDPIYAAEDGKVIRAGWNRGYGYNVMINHGNGMVTLYAHSSKLLVKKGDTVKRGDVIALIGSTGWSTGPHIHFEVRINGRKINPLTYTK